MKTKRIIPAVFTTLAFTALMVGFSVTALNNRNSQDSAVEAQSVQEVNTSEKQISNYAYAVLDIVNKERSDAGLTKLSMDKELLSAAMQRASEIHTYFSHTRPDGSSWNTISPKTYGENIAYGQNSPEEVMTAWMNSPGHRANILGSNYKSIGVGCVLIDGRYYWVQEFGNSSAEVTQTDDQTSTSTSLPLDTKENETTTDVESSTVTNSTTEKSSPVNTEVPYNTDNSVNTGITSGSNRTVKNGSKTGTDSTKSLTDKTCFGEKVGKNEECSKNSKCYENSQCPGNKECSKNSKCNDYMKYFVNKGCSGSEKSGNTQTFCNGSLNGMLPNNSSSCSPSGTNSENECTSSINAFRANGSYSVCRK